MISGGPLGGPSHSAVIAGHCLRAPGGSWDFPGTISHQPLQKVHPSSDANGPVQEKQQAVPADGHLPLVSRLLPSGGQFLAQNKVWLISPRLLGARRKLLPLDWEQGAFPPGRDMGSEGVSCHQACLGDLRRTLNPGASAEGAAGRGSLATSAGQPVRTAGAWGARPGGSPSCVLDR